MLKIFNTEGSENQQPLLIPASQVFFLMSPGPKEEGEWEQRGKPVSEEKEMEDLQWTQSSEKSQKNQSKCTQGSSMALYDYTKKTMRCFTLKGLSADSSAETKRQILNEYFRDQFQETFASFNHFESQLKSFLASSFSSSFLPALQKTALHLRTKERSAIRLGAELCIHTQWMELECQGNTDDVSSVPFCMLDNGMWKVKGVADDAFALQDTQYRWIQKELILWRDLYEKWQQPTAVYIQSQMTSLEKSLFAEATLWISVTNHILDLWREHEPEIKQSHLYVRKSIELFPDDRKRNAATNLNLGISMLDDVTSKVKIAMETFYTDMIQKNTKSGWSLDLLGVWSVLAYVSSMFFGSEPKDFATNEDSWSTLIHHDRKSTR